METSPKTYLSCAETAKLVRKALKNAFPGVKFSVRSDSYSGGASIDVRWTDGPTSGDVKSIAGQFSGASFDGMQDLKYDYSHWMLPDGTVTLAKVHHNLDPKSYPKPHPDATMVSFGADFVFCERKISKDLMLKAAAVALRDYALGDDVPVRTLTPEDLVEDGPYGPRWTPTWAGKYTGSRWVSDALYRAASYLRADGTSTHDSCGSSLAPEVP